MGWRSDGGTFQEDVDNALRQISRARSLAETEHSPQTRQEQESEQARVTDGKFVSGISFLQQARHHVQHLLTSFFPREVRTTKHFLALDETQEMGLFVKKRNDGRHHGAKLAGRTLLIADGAR